MKIDLPTKYDPKQVEDKWYKSWEEGRFFHSEPDAAKEQYSIVIPPPNVTGALHMGHALNNTIQDILIRWRRMQGRNALWMPGTDHAGIATQNVVEREIANENLTRWDLGREKFIQRVWQWKEEYGSRIITQLKKLGSSCDWERTRFTMDDGLSKAVLETFVQLYRRGLIYRGKYIINWCPRCQTALSDDEVDHEEREGHLWYVKYPFKNEPQLYVTVATTRPETMLGDTAVAVNPKDERFSEMVGEDLILPIIEREIPIIADDFVDPAFGTGAVKVTPAHDPNDFQMGLRHDLSVVVVMNPDATMNANAGDYNGADRFECREALVEELKQKKLLSRTEPYSHSVGHCYRCHTVIEPYLSDQWFVKMKPLAQAAIAATKEGRVRFHPERWTRIYLDWLENVRDWCISRQIWWGHRIPVWYCQDCDEINVAKTAPDRCSACGSNNLKQDEDVLDTWFSSALWPFSTMGWPEKTAELDYYYPTSTLVTDRGIIYFWVARMVMMGLEMMKDIPFSNVYIHGTILDEIGRKMSKSLGNGIDPLEMIEQYGSDAVRFSLIMLTTEGQDARLSESRFEMGRNFANKVWNAARFAITNLADCNQSEGGPPHSPNVNASVRSADVNPSQVPPEGELTFEDRWILSRLNRTVDACTRRLEQFQLNEAARTLYDFIWREFCDWYLEIIKHRLGERTPEKFTAQRILAYVLDNTLRLLHPFAPFLTEEIWQNLKLVTSDGEPTTDHESIMVADWPKCDESQIDDAIEQTMALLQDLVRSVRNIRSKMNIAQKQSVKAIISAEKEVTCELLKSRQRFLIEMANLEALEIGVGLQKPKSSAAEVTGQTQLFVPLEGLIDLDAERERLANRIEKVEQQLGGTLKKLNNPNFVEKAPAEIVERERQRKAELGQQIDKLRENLADLDGLSDEA